MELANEIKMESFEEGNDDYLKYCFYEALRIDPPVPISTSCCILEDMEICGVMVKAGEMMFVNMH